MTSSECMGRLLELHDIVAQLALDELLHFGDDLVLGEGFLLVPRALQ